MNQTPRATLGQARRSLARLESFSAYRVQIPVMQRHELALLRRYLDRYEIALDPTTRRARWLRLKLWLHTTLSAARQRVWEWRRWNASGWRGGSREPTTC